MGLDELLYQSINRFYYFLDEYSKKLGLTGDVLLCMKIMEEIFNYARYVEVISELAKCYFYICNIRRKYLMILLLNIRILSKLDA